MVVTPATCQWLAVKPTLKLNAASANAGSYRFTSNQPNKSNEYKLDESSYKHANKNSLINIILILGFSCKENTNTKTDVITKGKNLLLVLH